MKHARNGGPDLAFRLGRRVVSAVADDMSTTQRVGAGVAAALVAISPFGAWNKVEAQADPIVAGAPIEVGPFEVTVVRAVKAPELSYLAPAPGNHLLAVVVDVTNTSDVPEYGTTLSGAIPAPENVGIVAKEPLEDLGSAAGGQAGTGGAEPSADPSTSAGPDDADDPVLPPATVLNVEDATNVSVLNPGITYQVALIWEQSGRWSGDKISLEMLELAWIEESRLSLDNGYWLPGEVAFRGRIPVKDNLDGNGAASEADEGGAASDGSNAEGTQP